MYATVPTMVPTSVNVVACVFSRRANFAIPKSRTLTAPLSVTMTFPGLISRCSTPAACAAPNAEAIWAPISAIRKTDGRSRSIRMSNGVPETYSITRKSSP